MVLGENFLIKQLLKLEDSGIQISNLKQSGHSGGKTNGIRTILLSKWKVKCHDRILVITGPVSF